MDPRENKPSRDLGLYLKCLDRNRKAFPCPYCKTSVLPKKFEKHCTQLHDLNSKHCCVWCLGERSWSGKEKFKHVDHLLSCFRKFTSRLRPQEPENLAPNVKPEPVPFDTKPMAPKKCLFDHSFDPPPRAFDSIWLMALDPNPLTFEDDSLDKAVSCVRKYLELGDEVEWFHVMVRTLAFPDFLEAMDRDEGRSRTLPFSCWCDGGEPEEPRLRQHRHLIVVSSPPGHFVRDVWEKIQVRDRPRRNFKCLYRKRLDSTMHFVNTIGYLCQRESRCNFTGEDKKSPEKQNHFYLFESLPKDYRLPLVLQWEGGLVKLLDQNFKNLNRGDLVRAIMSFFERKWRFKIKDIPGIALGTVLPVAKDFAPCRGPTDSFLHLAGGRKLFFERDPDLRNLSREAWLRKQADMGNLFYFVVGEEKWTPRPYHQGLINDFKPVVDRNRELESENAGLKVEVAGWKQKHADSELEVRTLSVKNDELREKNSKLTDKNSELNDKIHLLNDKIHQLNEGEIARLRKENEDFRKELAEVKTENRTLKRENETLKRENEEFRKELDRVKRQNKKLRKELAAVKRENERLKKENESLKRENEDRAKRPRLSV